MNKNKMHKNILLSIIFSGVFFGFSAKGMENECEGSTKYLINNDKISVVRNGNILVYLLQRACPHRSIVLMGIKNLKSGKLGYKKSLREIEFIKEVGEVCEKEIDFSSEEIEFLKKKAEKYAKIELEKTLKKDKGEKKLNFGDKKMDEIFAKKTESEMCDNNYKAFRENLCWRYPFDLEGKDSELVDIMNKAGHLRYSKNVEIREQTFKNNPVCSFCGDSLLESSDYITCILCLKAFYCDANCQDIDYKYGHEFECLKSIKEEKEAKNLVK